MHSLKLRDWIGDGDYAELTGTDVLVSTVDVNVRSLSPTEAWS
jgi:hypothetical protein